MIVGIILASTLPVTEYEHFLFFIGSVFAPMIAVLIADFFVLKQHDVRKSVIVLDSAFGLSASYFIVFLWQKVGKAI